MSEHQIPKLVLPAPKDTYTSQEKELFQRKISELEQSQGDLLNQLKMTTKKLDGLKTGKQMRDTGLISFDNEHQEQDSTKIFPVASSHNKIFQRESD